VLAELRALIEKQMEDSRSSQRSEEKRGSSVPDSS
jgi:hypothetical protein